MSDSMHKISGDNAEYFRYVEKTLAAELELDMLRPGGHVIRNEKGWRENEKHVDYIWMVYVSRHFVGKACLFSVKFAETQFREYVNKAMFVEGFFIAASDNKEQLYTNTSDDTVFDIRNFNRLDLFDANKGIALDGVGYEIRIIAPNIDTFIQVGNPNSKEWVEWENDILKLGRKFGQDAGHPGMIKLFK